jgi:hypothetical protein
VRGLLCVPRLSCKSRYFFGALGRTRTYDLLIRSQTRSSTGGVAEGHRETKQRLYRQSGTSKRTGTGRDMGLWYRCGMNWPLASEQGLGRRVRALSHTCGFEATRRSRSTAISCQRVLPVLAPPGRCATIGEVSSNLFQRYSSFMPGIFWASFGRGDPSELVASRLAYLLNCLREVFSGGPLVQVVSLNSLVGF